MARLFWLAAMAFATATSAQAACGTLLSPMLVSATAVSFGNYSPGTATATTANGTISVDCVLSDVVPSFDVSITSGLATDFTPRTMQLLLLLTKLNYNLYTTSGLTTIWGDGTDTSVTKHHTQASGVGHVTMTVFGGIATGQFVPPGLYLDSVTVRITY